MKTKITLLGILTLALFVQTSVQAQFFKPDLAVTSVTVANVNGNSVTFNYVVQNVASFASLDLSRLYFQTYVSQNSTYDASDLPAGGAIFGNNAPNLAPGQSYSGSWTSNSSSSLESYRYLVFTVKLRSGYTAQETNLANNTLVRNIAPNFADLVVNDITVSNVNGNSVTYSYTIRNAGYSTLYLDRFLFQTYVSQNSIYDASDSPSGGAIFSTTPLTLAPGALYTGSWTSNAGVSLQTYPYLIVDVRLRSGQVHPQISTSNDRYIKYLTPGFADLVVNNIAVNQVNGNSVGFTYTVTNQGNSTLYLDRFYFQTYVSSNNVYDASDSPAGGAVFTTGSLTLAPGASYNGGWTSNATVSLQTNPYLIFDVRLESGQVHPQTSLTNDRYVKYLTPSFADLVVSSISVNEASANRIDFNYTIKNQGASTLYLDRHYFQAYVSSNPTLELGDIPAGGSLFSSIETPIAPGQTYTGRWVSTLTVDIASYPYLIFDVGLLTGKVQPQISLTNDRYAKYVVPTFADLAVVDMVVDSLIGNRIEMHLKVQNNGTSVLNLQGKQYNFYSSQNASLEYTNDVLVSTHNFIDNGTGLILLPGEIRYFYASVYANTNLNNYPYLILEAPYSSDVDPINNKFNAYLPNLFADLTFGYVTLRSLDGIYHTEYNAINQGELAVHLNRYHILSYYSADNVFDASDLLVGDVLFEQEALNDPVLYPGEGTDDTIALQNQIDPSAYGFFIVVIQSLSGQDYEQNYFNNTFIVPIPVFAAAASEKSLLASSTYKVERQEGAVHLENISGNKLSTSYILYSTTGEKVSEGSFEQTQQINTLGFKNGIYIVKLSDGNTAESVKILIQE